MANPNIFQTYLQQPKSIADYTAEMDMQDLRREQLVGARNTNAVNALTAQQTADTMRQNAIERAALRDAATKSGGDRNALIGLLRNSGMPGLMSQADALEKGGVEMDKGRASVRKDTADARAKEFETRKAMADQAVRDIAALSSPEQAKASLDAHLQKGDIDQEKYQAVLATLPQNPADFPRWQLGMLKNIMSAKDRLELEQRQATADQNARNDLVGTDGKPNAAVIEAKKQIAKAGASSVSVNTGQKGIENEMKLRDDFRSEPIYKAHSEVKSAYSQIQQGLKLKSPAGDLAAATKIMKLLDPGSVVRESELGMAMAATGLMDRVTNYATNIMQGTKLTEAQRADFQKLADALYGESVKQYDTKRQEYGQFASEWGLNPSRVAGPAAKKPDGAAPAQAGGVVDFNSLK